MALVVRADTFVAYRSGRTYMASSFASPLDERRHTVLPFFCPLSRMPTSSLVDKNLRMSWDAKPGNLCSHENAPKSWSSPFMRRWST